MPAISVITPFHKEHTGFLKEAYESLCEQTFTDWEWIIVKNGDASHRFLAFCSQDPRVRIHSAYELSGNIGALKGFASSLCEGVVICELDYDDLLTPDCLDEVWNAFKEENIHMVYSNDALFFDKTWHPHEFGYEYGWKARDFEYKGHPLKEMIGWAPSAQSFRRVEWAPDHVRAWRKSSYDSIGGHDDKLRTGDDHDLCCRFYIQYGQSGIKHIDKCLYLYRKQEANSSVVDNHLVQQQTDQNYLKYSRMMAERWARDNNLRIIDLGGRIDSPEGYESVDLQDADIIADLNKPWPFTDGEVGVIRASHVLEHLENPIHAMNEAFRVLSGGGFFFIDVPSTDGRGAFQDPTHRTTFWNENSFWYYTRTSHARYITPQYHGRFQCARIVTWFPNEFMQRYNISVVQADLICLKTPYSLRPQGEVLI